MAKYKLAICIRTYERPDTVQTHLKKVAQRAQENGYGIYIFDASLSNKTQIVCENFIKKGYTNIYYYHYDEKPGDLYIREYDCHTIPDADYILYTGDKYIINPKNYGWIDMLMEKAYTAIIINHRDIEQLGFREYGNPVNMFKDLSWHMACMGTAIVRKDIIGFVPIEELKQYRTKSSYGTICLYFPAFARCQNFKAVHVPMDVNLLFNLCDVAPGWVNRKDFWSVSGNRWIDTIMMMPSVYNKCKKETIKSGAFVGYLNHKGMFNLRRRGVYDLQILRENWKTILATSVLNPVELLLIALLPTSLFSFADNVPYTSKREMEIVRKHK